jgi:hypothetical protein
MFQALARASLIGALLSFVAFSAPAAGTDPADVAFWQSVQSSKNAAEYQAYLNAFPHGVFVEVARARIKEFSGGTAGAPALGPVVGRGIMTATPAAVDVGEQITISFAKFPKLGPFDQLVVVPAGTPDSASSTGPIAAYYFNMIALDTGAKVGPFAPGTYEARWLTTLYNNKGQVQIGARVQFAVNP